MKVGKILTMQILIHAKVAQLEKAVLPLLKLLHNHEIHRFNRLQAALYALKDDFLPDYDFPSQNCWSAADNEVRHNIKFLCGKIQCRIQEISNTSYAVYKLTDEGLDDAERYFELLSDQERVKLENVAKCLNDHNSGKSLSALVDCLNRV